MSSSSPRRYLVLPLDHTLPSSRIPQLLGLIVLNPYQPLTRYAPTQLVPSDVVPGIKDDTMDTEVEESMDRTFEVKAKKAGSVRAALESLVGGVGYGAGVNLSGGIGKKTSQAVRLSNKKTRRYSMTQNKLKFETLMSNEECAREVRELLKESKSTGGRGKVWMVVGFLTTGETRWFVEKREGKAVGGRVGVPLVGHVLPNVVSAPSASPSGLPGEQEHEPPSSQVSTNPEPPISPSNTSLRGTLVTSSHLASATTGTVPGEAVFAITYDVVRFRYGYDRRALGFVSGRPVLGGEMRVKGGHLALGPEGSDEEIEEEGEDEDEDDDEGSIVLESDEELDTIPEEEDMP